MTTNDNFILDNQNSNINDIPLYNQSNITRKQAINEIGNVILCSNMKPRIVRCALELLKKLLPMDNTLPNTIDELFRAMISSENNWRLTQYLIKYKQCPSLASLSLSNMSNENSNMTIAGTNPTLIQYEQASDEIVQPISPSNNHESSSSSDDQDELSPYDRLQLCLRPITDLSRNINLYYETSLHNNNIPLLDHRSQSSSSSDRSATVRQLSKRRRSETSSTTSSHDSYQIAFRRMLEEFKGSSDNDDETICCSTSVKNKKLCCFELNGYNLLNDSKRRRYF